MCGEGEVAKLLSASAIESCREEKKRNDNGEGWEGWNIRVGQAARMTERERRN